MKKGIHPKFYADAKIVDNSSGSVFVVGSTVENVTVEISSLTHPFYTGKQRIVDTDNLVEKFNQRIGKTDKATLEKKKAKKLTRRTSSVTAVDNTNKLTLKDMLKSLR
jgi:large subunit ribosomal protein L31